MKTEENARERRWREEARFFDERASRSPDAAPLLDPFALRRYTNAKLRSRFNKEYRFLVLGDLAGKRILDAGCGDGSNAVLLAKMGAAVTGIDISPASIEASRRRAEANGASDRAPFLRSPLEHADLPAKHFDVIWGDAVLHHLIAELDFVMTRLCRYAKPGGTLLFAEPAATLSAFTFARSPFLDASIGWCSKNTPLNASIRFAAAYRISWRVPTQCAFACRYSQSSAARPYSTAKIPLSLIDVRDAANPRNLAPVPAVITCHQGGIHDSNQQTRFFEIQPRGERSGGDRWRDCRRARQADRHRLGHSRQLRRASDAARVRYRHV